MCVWRLLLLLHHLLYTPSGGKDGHTRVGVGSQQASQPATHLNNHPNNGADENDRGASDELKLQRGIHYIGISSGNNLRL